jgi:hypothetical protein
MANISFGSSQPGQATKLQAQTTDSGTFSVLRSLDAEIPASTEYCAKRSAGRDHESNEDKLTINNQLSTKNYFQLKFSDGKAAKL